MILPKFIAENKSVFVATMAVVTVLGGSMTVSLPADRKVAEVEKVLYEYIAMEDTRQLARDLQEIRWQIEGAERDLKVAVEQGWGPGDEQDLRDKIRWLKDKEQRLLDRMRSAEKG